MVLSIFILMTIHFILICQIQKRQTKVEILQKSIQKNPDPTSSNPRRSLALAQTKQQLLLTLFSCMTKSQIQWRQIVKQKENIILQGETMQFSQLQNFLFMTEKHHLHLMIQKIEVKEVLHFQLFMDVKNG
jgi:hypothetical protein